MFSADLHVFIFVSCLKFLHSHVFVYFIFVFARNVSSFFSLIWEKKWKQSNSFCIQKTVNVLNCTTKTVKLFPVFPFFSVSCLCYKIPCFLFFVRLKGFHFCRQFENEKEKRKYWLVCGCDLCAQSNLCGFPSVFLSTLMLFGLRFLSWVAIKVQTVCVMRQRYKRFG